MKLKWQWFLGGRAMFWMSTVLILVYIFIYIMTYVIDPAGIYIKKQNANTTTIQEVSETYMKDLGVNVKKPIVYRFVKFRNESYFKTEDDMVLLGTFHEWNNCYYIDISINYYHMSMLYETVEHETRHMLVQELKNEKIIDLTEYSEEIAQGKNKEYNDLFDSSINLLKEKNKNGEV